jgi:hypothetical protein
MAGLTRAPELTLVQELQQVPGSGPVIAATLVARWTACSFGHSDEFVASCGLDVRVRQSRKKSGPLGLSQQGEAELRRLLYLAAQASLRAKDSPFKAQYERQRQKGLSSTAALCAVARHIARLSWSLVTHGTCTIRNGSTNKINDLDLTPTIESPGVVSSFRHAPLLAHHHMRATHRQSGVGVPFIGVKQTARCGVLRNQGQQLRPAAALNGKDAHYTIALEHPKCA